MEKRFDIVSQRLTRVVLGRMQMIWVGAAVLGLIVASTWPAVALCENTGKTCIETKRFYQEGVRSGGVVRTTS